MAQFERLEAWRACRRLTIAVYGAVKLLPEYERHVLWRLYRSVSS